MSGLKGHRISADMFAMMLKRGLTLPPYRIEGGKSWSSTASTRSMTFDMQDAVEFSEKFHKIQSPDG